MKSPSFGAAARLGRRVGLGILEFLKWKAIEHPLNRMKIVKVKQWRQEEERFGREIDRKRSVS